MDLIDKGLPIPYHCQLREILRHEGVTGRWPINEKLASERELGARFQVGRPTVREAIDTLVKEGLLRREKGLGTFVTEQKIVEGLLQTPHGFTDAINAQGIPFVRRVMHLEVGPTPIPVAHGLRLAGEMPVIVLDRLRFAWTCRSYLCRRTYPRKCSLTCSVKILHECRYTRCCARNTAYLTIELSPSTRYTESKERSYAKC